jgi:molybdopterin converting factor subunit 1
VARALRGYLGAMVRVLYFAGARDRTGTSSEELALGGKTVKDALLLLADKHARLAEVLPLCRVAVDQAFTQKDHVLTDGCELALIPPVAGG